MACNVDRKGTENIFINEYSMPSFAMVRLTTTSQETEYVFERILSSVRDFADLLLNLAKQVVRRTASQ